MCARYVLELNPIDLAKILRAALTDDEAYSPSWNIAPTRQAPVLLRSRKDHSRRIEVFRWGLLPPWAAENEGAKLVNVRSETAFEKRTSAEAVRERRCLVPLSGWYEWQRSGKKPQPFYFSQPDAPLMLGAGVWNVRKRESGEFLFTYALLTRAGEGAVAAIHDRMPVVLPTAAAEVWMNPAERDVRVLNDALGAYRADQQVWPVSPIVNNSRSEGASLIERIADQLG